MAAGHAASRLLMMASLSVSWIICGALLAAVMLFSFFSARGQKKGADQFLTGGRGFGPAVLVLSIFATSNTGFMFVGAVGAGFSKGIAAFWLAIAWAVGEITFWCIFPPKINRFALAEGPVSIPDYIAKGLKPAQNSFVRKIAGFIVAATTLPFIVAQDIAAGKALTSIVMMNTSSAVLLAGGTLTVIALLYCAWGGLKASIMANAVQGSLILLIGGILTTLAAAELLDTPQPLASLRSSNPHVFDPFATTPASMIVFFILGGATASFGGAMGLPTGLMRISVADSPQTLKRIRWWYLATCYLFLGSMIGLGIILSGLSTGATDPEQSLFVFAANHSPMTLGLALGGAAILILSTLDGSILVGGAALSDDMGNAGNTAGMVQKGLRVAGIVTFSFAALLIAATTAEMSVYKLILFGVSAMAGGIGPAFLIVTLRLKTHPLALIATMVTGVITAVVWAALGLSEHVAEALPSFILALFAHKMMLLWVQKFQNKSLKAAEKTP